MQTAKAAHITDDGVNITIYRTPANYTGKAIIGKIGRTYSDYSVGNKRMLQCLIASNLATGEIVSDGTDSYLCIVSKAEVIQGTEVSIIGHGLLCNATITVTRATPTYDSALNITGASTSTIVSGAVCRADSVTGRMRQEEPGLLDTTILKAYAANNANVNKLDKATVGGNYYRVDHIDRLQIPGAMILQLGAWTGG